jgi:hypothetical protein
MREQSLAYFIVLALCVGCATPESNIRTRMVESATDDGLALAVSDEKGDLFLRENHEIGGYDAVAVAPAFFSYRRGSTRLDDDLKVIYLASLEQALYDAAEETGAEIVDEVNSCVIKIGVGLVNVDLARPGSSSDVLGKMTLIMEFRDAESDQSLLRFVRHESIDRESDGGDRRDHIRDNFDRMIESIDIVNTLRAARVRPADPRPGCDGDLLRVGPPDPALGAAD